MEENKQQTIAEEAGLPSNWEPIDVAPIIPAAIPNPNSSGSIVPIVGSLPPSYQQNTDFAGTSKAGGRVPNLSLMPLGIQGNPSTNAGIISTAIKATTSVTTSSSVTGVASIAINKQTGTSYTVQVSDLDTLITFNNNSGGTITLPGPAGPAFAFKQVVHGTSAGVLTISITPTAHSLLILQVTNASGGGNVQPTIVDGNGNTWHYIASTVNGGNIVTNFYYAYNVNAGADSVAITNFYGAGSGLVGQILEYSGFAASDPLDSFDIHQSTTSSVTTGHANSLVFSGINFPGASNPTFGAGFTSRYNDTASLSQDQFVASSGTPVTSDSVPTVVGAGAVDFVASFKTATGPSSINFPAGWFTYIENTGTGTFVITAPTANIDGLTQNISLPPNTGVLLVFDGTNWYSERGISLSIPVTVANGGTGDATLTAHAVLLGEGASPVAFASPGTAGQLLVSNGASSDPTFQVVPASTLSNGTTGSGAIVLAASPTLTGTVALPIATLSGKITNYNGIATVSDGVPAEYATIDLTAQAANISAATLYAVPASGVGMYRISAYVVETTAASISSTLPNVQIVYTDPDTNTSITIDATPILGAAGLGQTGVLTANTVGTAASGIIVISAKASTTIQYQTVNYASVAAGMQYALHLKLEAL